MLAGEPTVPVNRDVTYSLSLFDVDDDLFHQMPDDLFAIPVGHAGGVPERGEIGGECRDPRPLLMRELRWLFTEESIIIVPDLPIGPQRLLPPLLQRTGHEAILRIDSSVRRSASSASTEHAPAAVSSACPGGRGPAGCPPGPTAQLHRSGFQGEKELLHNEVIDRCSLKAETGLLGLHVEMAGTR